MEREWSSRDLLTFAPVIATSFAFAFNVGYFWAIDIGWFALFSLPEHIVFALRALPIGIAASLIFVFGYNFPSHEKRPRWLSICSRWLWRAWFLFLLVAGAYSLFHFRPGISFSFFVVALATFIHYKFQPPQMSFVNVAYWVSTAFFVTLIVGYGSASSWLFHNQQRSVINAGSAEPRVAKLILTGARGILIYEPEAKEQSVPKKPTKERPREGLISELLRVLMDDPDKSGQGQIRLVIWDDIKDISLCPNSDPLCLCPHSDPQCNSRQNQPAVAPLH
jgi:hypothetical protein